MGRLARRRVHAVCGAALVVGSLGGVVITSGSAGAAPTTVTLYVSTSGTKTSGCTAPGPTACKTIQEGVAAAEALAGDAVTVKVAVGTYTGGVTIAAGSLASLTIRGTGGPSSTGVTGHQSERDFAVTSGKITIRGISIDDGHTTRFGAGVENLGTLSLTDDSFLDNTATSFFGEGGGVYNDRTLTLKDDSFSGDRAGNGAGVFNTASGTVTMTDDTFSTDSAKYEGGAGGGILNTGGTAIVTDVTFSDDSAGLAGGGVFNAFRGTVTMTDDTFSADSATSQGGGVWNTGGTAIVTDVTFSDDSAGNEGGGLFNATGASTVTASILDASSCYNTSGSLSGTYNVATTATCDSFGTEVTPSALDLTATLKPNTSTGPETLALGPTSPAVDEVPKTACRIKSDERGDPRPGIKGQTFCDAGAYELQHTPGTLTQGKPKKGSVTHGSTATFELAVKNPQATTGKVSFEVTGAVPTGVTVASTGKIAVSASTRRGKYTLTGSDADPLLDSGTWIFVLRVTG